MNLDLDPNKLMATMLFGLFGSAYFLYGKKQGHAVALVSGILLIVYPYFFDQLWQIIAVGTVLVLLPVFIKSSS